MHKKENILLSQELSGWDSEGVSFLFYLYILYDNERTGQYDLNNVKSFKFEN